ncbi:MAG: hypothetical protein ACL7BU_10320 [Candidatus Phlomobacter fragariae]
MEHNGRKNIDDGKNAMRIAISLLLKEVTDSDKVKISKQDLAELIDKKNNNDINYVEIKNKVTTMADLKILYKSINN